MENNFDIKQLIGDAFHEIYNQPLDEMMLNELFNKTNLYQFESSNLDYCSDEILAYSKKFKECLKHSFSCPVLHHGEFDSFSHSIPSRVHTNTDNENDYQICGTPLIEINNLFQKFSLLINLYFIKKDYESNSLGIELGRKRKYDEISQSSNQNYDDLPVATLSTLTSRTLEML